MSIYPSTDIHTDKSFNLTEYYALKSVKLSDAYMVYFKFNNILSKSKEYIQGNYEDIFFCESIKVPSIKNDTHKTGIGSVGNKYGYFSHKPFNDLEIRLLENDNCDVYKFIRKCIGNRFDALKQVYQRFDESTLDCKIEIYDNALVKKKMEVELFECEITAYNNSNYNSTDTSTPYFYDIALNFNAIQFGFPQ